MDDDPFSEAPVARKATVTGGVAPRGNNAEPVSPRAGRVGVQQQTAGAKSPRVLTPYEQKILDQQQLEDFMLSIGQTEALAQLEQRNLTWPKLKNAQESDVVNAGLPKRVAAAIVEGLKADTSTKLYALAHRPRVVVNLDARSVEIDYEAVADADLPPLPREPPPMSSRIEYKNYMRLRYEHQRRGMLEQTVSPRGSARPGPGPAPPSPTMADGPKSPRKRPQRAAPPPPTDVPAFDVVVQMRKSGAPLPPAAAAAVASPQVERAVPPVSPTVPPKPVKKEEVKKEEPKVVAKKKSEENIVVPEEEVHKKASPNPQRLTEMFATMEAKLNLQAKMKAEAQKEAAKPKKAEAPKKEEPKKVEPKKEPPRKEDTTNLSEMLDEIDDEVADLDEILKPADNNVAAMRKSHLEELSEVLADADEFDVGPTLRDSFFDSAVDKKKDDDDWGSEKKEDKSEEESEESRASLPYPSKPLPRETDASEIYADVAIPKRGSEVTEPSVSQEAKKDSDDSEESDLTRLAKGGGDESESESEEMGLPIVLASGVEADSELPSLPPVASDDDDDE